MKVRIGISDVGREVELEIDDVEAFERSVEAAITSDDVQVFWVTDTTGDRVGIPVDKIGVIVVEAERPAAGFRS